MMLGFCKPHFWLHVRVSEGAQRATARLEEEEGTCSFLLTPVYVWFV